MEAPSRTRPYVGMKHPHTVEIVNSSTRVTPQTHPQYHTVKGPFKTKRGADYLVKHPHPEAISKLSVAAIEAEAEKLGVGAMI